MNVQQFIKKHTPGPWFVFGNGHCVGGPFEPQAGDNPAQQTAGVAMCGMRLRDPEEACANAALIAAAPELLAVSRRVARELASLVSPEHWSSELGSLLREAEEAITKAEGRGN